MKATVQIHLNNRDATVSCEFDDSQLRSDLMSVKDDLKADIAEVRASQEATRQAVLDAVASETAQVAATIASLEGKLGDMLSDADLAEIKADLDSLKSHPEDLVSAIDAIHNPATGGGNGGTDTGTGTGGDTGVGGDTGTVTELPPVE
jgi:hypothetical protein